jgi:CENP-B N-terminal DNA-binding domain.
MIAQKLERIRKLESGESQIEVIASYNIGSSTMCDIEKQKDQFLYFEV